MALAALIEIVPTADGVLPHELIADAYRSSVADPVALVFDDALVRAVDRVLDALVPLLPLGIPGVRYVSAADVAQVAHLARQARVVVLQSPQLRACAGLGPVAAVMPVAAGTLPTVVDARVARRSASQPMQSLPAA